MMKKITKILFMMGAVLGATTNISAFAAETGKEPIYVTSTNSISPADTSTNDIIKTQTENTKNAKKPGAGNFLNVEELFKNDEDKSNCNLSTMPDGLPPQDSRVTKVGWNKLKTGYWVYSEDGICVYTGWKQIDNSWYFLGNLGIMQTGWLNDNGTWYYLNTDGSMKTGWLNDNGAWYYLNTDGSMKTGWLNDNGTWYYLNTDGSMAHDTIVGSCKLGSNGAWIQ